MIESIKSYPVYQDYQVTRYNPIQNLSFLLFYFILYLKHIIIVLLPLLCKMVGSLLPNLNPLLLKSIEHNIYPYVSVNISYMDIEVPKLK